VASASLFLPQLRLPLPPKAPALVCHLKANGSSSPPAAFFPTSFPNASRSDGPPACWLSIFAGALQSTPLSASLPSCPDGWLVPRFFSRRSQVPAPQSPVMAGDGVLPLVFSPRPPPKGIDGGFFFFCRRWLWTDQLIPWCYPSFSGKFPPLGSEAEIFFVSPKQRIYPASLLLKQSSFFFRSYSLKWIGLFRFVNTTCCEGLLLKFPLEQLA